MFYCLPNSSHLRYNTLNSIDGGKYAGEPRQGRGHQIEMPARTKPTEVPS